MIEKGRGLSVEIGGNKDKGVKPLVTMGLFGSGKNALDGTGALNLRLIGYNKDRGRKSGPSAEQTVAIVQALEKVSLLRKDKAIPPKTAEELTQQLMRELNKTSTNEPLFTGILPTTLRGMRKGYQWAAEKGLNKMEERLDGETNTKTADSHPRRPLLRTKGDVPKSGHASADSVLDTKTGKFVPAKDSLYHDGDESPRLTDPTWDDATHGGRREGADNLDPLQGLADIPTILSKDTGKFVPDPAYFDSSASGDGGGD